MSKFNYKHNQATDATRLRESDKVSSKSWGKVKEHLTDYESDSRTIIESGYCGWDGEYIPPTQDDPQVPILNALTFKVNKIPKVLKASKRLKTIESVGVYSGLGIPHCLYSYLIRLKDAYPKVAKGESGYVVGFVFDVRGIQAGGEFQAFFNASFLNIYEHTDITIKSDRKDNTKIATTYSEAELGMLLPNRNSEIEFRRFNNTLQPKLGDKATILTLQGTTMISHYPIQTSKYSFDCVDIIDTRYQGGGSVAKIGKSLGLDKVKGFNFDTNDANYYLEHYQEDFCYYNFVDALISLGSELFIHKALVDVVNDCVGKGVVSPDYSDKVTLEDKAKRKRTSSGIGEVLVEGLLKKDKIDGKYKNKMDKLDRVLHPDDSKVLGGLNQRTTGVSTPELFPNLNIWDFKSHYPTCCMALGKFPFYLPKHYGYVKSVRAKDLYEQLDYLDWYQLRISCEYPKDTPLLKRLHLQNYNGDSCNPEIMEEQLITPPVLGVMAAITPDLLITIERGYYWDREILESELEGGQNPDDYYIDLTQLFLELMSMRDEYKADGNDLMQTAVKLVMNSIYGKFAQDKYVLDPDSLDLTLVNDGEISSVSNRAKCTSNVTYSVYANAITGLGRAVTWWVAYKYDAVLCVTDSIAVTHDKDIDLKECQSNNKWINSYINYGSIKLETPEQMGGIISGVRGRCLFYYDAELLNTISTITKEDLAHLDNLLTPYIEKQKQLGKQPPKIAKDGFKYDGESWEVWKQCTIKNIYQLVGEPVKHHQTSLVKRNEVRQRKHNNVNETVHKTLDKDCVELRSQTFRTVDDYYTEQKVQDKFKRDSKRPPSDRKYNCTYGQALRAYPELIEQERKKTKPRPRKAADIPHELKRAIVILTKNGLVSQKSVADLLGCTKQSISYWTNKLDLGKTEDYWGGLEIQDYKEVKHHLKSLSGEDITRILQKNQKLGFKNEVDDKRIVIHIQACLAKLERYFGVSFQTRSPRAKKLIVGQAA